LKDGSELAEETADCSTRTQLQLRMPLAWDVSRCWRLLAKVWCKFVWLDTQRRWLAAWQTLEAVTSCPRSPACFVHTGSPLRVGQYYHYYYHY